MSRATLLGTIGVSGFNDFGNVFTSRGGTNQPTFSAVNVGGGVANLNFDRSNPLTRIAVNKSTGIVTVSAVPGRSDMQAADWTTGRNVSDWGTLQAYLSATAYSNRNISPSAVNFRLFGTTRGYSNSMHVHPNGKIYIFPFDITQTTQGYVIDPDSERIIATFFQTYYVSRASLAPNGKFYLPTGSTRLVVLDPSTNNINQTINTSPWTFGFETLARNGKFYLIQKTSTITGAVFFDPVTETTGSFSCIIDSSNTPAIFSGSYNGTVLAPNGKIYTIPYYSTCFTVIDPDTQTSSTYGFVGGYDSGTTWGKVMDFEGGVLAINGKIYCIPHNVGSAVPASRIGIINPDDNTTTTFAGWVGSSASVNCQTAFLAPNGKIYTAPNQDSFVVIIDPDTNTTTKLVPSIGFPSLQAQGGVMHPNGKAFFVPYYTTSIGVMDLRLNNNWDINVCTNPMFNKQT